MVRRFKNAIILGVWAFKNPQSLQPNNFKMLSQILELILKVGTENKPLMSKLCVIHPIDGMTMELVSIWAGPGIAACPTKRIKELVEENQKLKRELEKALFDKENKSSE